jgi:hypothetical protein
LGKDFLGGEEERRVAVGLENRVQGPGRRVTLWTEGVDNLSSGQPRGSGDINVFSVVEMDDLLGERTGGGTDDDGQCSNNRSVPVSPIIS